MGNNVVAYKNHHYVPQWYQQLETGLLVIRRLLKSKSMNPSASVILDTLKPAICL